MSDEDRFLESYNRVEQHLRKLANDHENTRFRELLERVVTVTKDRAVDHYKWDLYQLSDLRNLVIHYRGVKPVAQPNAWAVNRMGEIAEALTAPKRALAIANTPVETRQDSDTLDGIVKLMYEKSYSQVPVMRGDSLVSVLTTNTITRWLAQPANNEIVCLTETPVKSVLKFAAPEDKKSFVLFSRERTVFDVIEEFRQGKHDYPIDAILITAHGKVTESILGIITAADLPKAYKLLRLP